MKGEFVVAEVPVFACATACHSPVHEPGIVALLVLLPAPGCGDFSLAEISDSVFVDEVAVVVAAVAVVVAFVAEATTTPPAAVVFVVDVVVIVIVVVAVAVAAPWVPGQSVGVAAVQRAAIARSQPLHSF